MQINRLLSLERPFMQRGFLWMEAAVMLLTAASLFFSYFFILVEHFHRVAPRSSAALNLQHLQLWRFEATISVQSIAIAFKKFMLQTDMCIWNNIVVCAVWYSAVSQTSRAANMAIHALLWGYVCVNKWKWLTKRKPHFKLPTFTLNCGFKDRASEI